MSFHPLGDLFERTPTKWQAEDVRHYIQQYLRRELKTEQLYCDELTTGVARVRVATPATAHAAHLLEYDLARDLRDDTKQELKQLKVRLST